MAAGLCSLVISSVDGMDGAVPRIGSYYEPLHGCFDSRRCLSTFAGALAKGARKPVDAFGKLNMVAVPEMKLRGIDPELRSFWSLNSPEDLGAAEKLLRGDG